MKNFFAILLFSLSTFLAPPSVAGDIEDAGAVAVAILNLYDAKKGAVVWDDHVSTWFKGNMTREAFLANTAFLHAQLGGPSSSRKLVQRNRSDGDARVGFKGDVFSFTFSTTYPSSKVYENIVLIREGGSYKLSGLNFAPNPN